MVQIRCGVANLGGVTLGMVMVGKGPILGERENDSGSENTLLSTMSAMSDQEYVRSLLRR